jgi:hypothetical protein
MKNELMRVPKNDWRRELHNGDEVFWNDPNDDMDSQTITIGSIQYFENDSASIMDKKGEKFVVFLHELS